MTKKQDTNHWAGILPYPMAHKNIRVKNNKQSAHSKQNAQRQCTIQIIIYSWLNRWVLKMKSMVSLSIREFCELLRPLYPYSRQDTLSLMDKSAKLTKICDIFAKRDVLRTEKKGHISKKCVVSSGPFPHRQVSFSVSAKLWDFLWAFRGLKATRSWKIRLIPSGLWTLKITFFIGRMR